jgi:DNA-directed RNA polymerase specialized sigma subunit
MSTTMTAIAVTGDRGRAGVPATRPACGATVQELLCQRAELPGGHPDRAGLRIRGIEAGLPLARSLAARYTGRGEPLDDLYQVAALALVRAVDGYSLDAPSATDGQEQLPLLDTIGAVDARFDTVVDRYTLRPLLAALPAHQRRILAMRYFDDMTQAQIATRIGLSQMQISRLLVRTLTQLRTGMLAEPLPSTRPAPDRLAVNPG